MIKLHFGAILWFLTMASVGAWFGVMFVNYEVPYHYLGPEDGSYILPDPADEGKMVTTFWKLTPVKKDCPRKVERIFLDPNTGNVITTLDATPLSRTVQTSTTMLSRSFAIPAGLPSKIDYQVRTCFQCDILQRFFPVCTVSPKLPLHITAQ